MSVRLKWDGDKVLQAIENAAVSGLDEALEYLLDESNKVVPHKEGILQDSGETSIDKDELTGDVYYDTPYAMRLHEHPEYDFENGRQGKWLENTFINKGKRAADYIAKKLQGTIGD